MTTIAHVALVLTGAAAFFGVLAWLILTTPKTPAAFSAQTSPPVCDAAVEAPEAGAVIPPAVPASGTPTFDADVDQALAIANNRPIRVWCVPCGGPVYVDDGRDVINHIVSHLHSEGRASAAHFEQWEREFHPATGGNNDRNAS